MTTMPPDLLEEPAAAPEPVQGARPAPTRSPSQIAWERFKRDRVGVFAALVVGFYLLVALCAPLIGKIYGRDPYTTYGLNHPGLLTSSGLPAHPHGGISNRYWLGIEPGLGRDVFMQLVYGARTSLFIAITIALITSVVGVIYGITTGYLGGRADRIAARVLDLFLVFPGLLLIIALSPIVESRFVAPDEETPVWLRFATVIFLFSLFGWTFQARLIRGEVLSLREREFVDAARMSGASTWRIVRKELLPNLWSPILVTFSIAVPGVVAGEAALAFLGIGIVEPTPDWGRMVSAGKDVYLSDPTYMVIPGAALLILVLAANILGDAVRDALDPKGLR
jgi:peptide/nickel transport system permease protein